MSPSKYQGKNTLVGRLLRSFIAVIILSAFVLGVSLLIKNLSTLNEDKFAQITSEALSKANIEVEEEQVGEVAGKFIERLTNTNISSTSTSRVSEEDSKNKESNSKLILEVAVIADVHEDLASLERAINLIKERNINTVFVIGDLTAVGDTKSLEEVKQKLVESDLKYYVLPGDHDLAKSLSNTNFVQVFGYDHMTVELEGTKFTFLDNSANFTQINTSLINWFKDEIKYADFVVLSQPLYADNLGSPFNKMYMGSTKDVVEEVNVEKQKRVKEQRDMLLSEIQNSQSVNATIAGDHHKSSKQIDPKRGSLIHYAIGSVAGEVNELPQRLIQSSRFSVLSVYEDKSFSVEDILLDEVE